ncbi:NAD-dependent epimerase/dehydratase family protein [Geodermatophilus sp. SYSU D00815]
MHSTVLVLGATGYLGTPLVERLSDTGHRVEALLQPGVSPADLPGGVGVRVGDLTDPASLTAAVTPDVDAVVHLVPPAGDLGVDRAAIEALVAPLRGSGRAFVYTSGAWVLGPTGGRLLDEAAPTNPIEIVRYRPALEEQVLAAAAEGVRSVVLRPGVAHGRGGGIPALLVRLAAEHGVGRYVGTPLAHWPMVHVDDLADLFVLALERAEPGRLLHAVHEAGVASRDLAAAAAVAAGVTGAEPWPLADAAAALGAAFAEALACDQLVSGERARTELGWSPRRAGALVDVAAGSYAPARAAA